MRSQSRIAVRPDLRPATTFWTYPVQVLCGLMMMVAVLAAGCASTPDNPHFRTMSESEIYGIVEEYTQNRKIYDGFMNNLDVSATLVTDEVGRALLDQGARIYQWDQNAFANEKSKAESFRAGQTEIFLSFFVPERKWDDLNKKSTNWKIFLDANGKRYEGKAVRWKTEFVEVKTFYPHHTRWGTPYKVSFPVSTRDIESTTSKLTLTGPVGTVSMDFMPGGSPAPALPITEPAPVTEPDSLIDSAPASDDPGPAVTEP